MQIKSIILLCLFLNSNLNIKNRENEIFFKQANLVYNDYFYLSFMPITEFYDKYELYVNKVLVSKVFQLTNWSVIDLKDLKYGQLNTIDIVLQKHNLIIKKSFNINLQSEYDITNLEKFSMNQLIEDYQKIFSFREEQFLNINNFCYEVINNKPYFEFDKIGSFEFNDKNLLCQEIVFKITTTNLYNDLVYDHGYYFDLALVKQNNYHLVYQGLNQKSIKGINKLSDSKQLYIPIYNQQKIVEGEITFVSIYKSKIDLSIDIVFDINQKLFGNDGKFTFFINEDYIDHYQEYFIL